MLNFTDILLATVLVVGALAGLLGAKALGVPRLKRKEVIAFLGICVSFSLGTLFFLQMVIKDFVIEIPQNLFVVFAGCFCFLGTYLFAVGFLLFLRDFRQTKN